MRKQAVFRHFAKMRYKEKLLESPCERYAPRTSLACVDIARALPSHFFINR